MFNRNRFINKVARYFLVVAVILMSFGFAAMYDGFDSLMNVRAATWYSKADFTQGTVSLGSINTGTVIMEFDMTPLANNIDCVVGYTDTSVNITSWNNMAMQIAMMPDSTIKVRNGDAYDASPVVTYSANNTYHFKVSTSLSSRLYSVWVTAPGGSQTLIAQNYAFRSEGPSIDDVGKICIKSESDNQAKVDNHTGTGSVSTYRINAGGSTVSTYAADSFYSGASTVSTTTGINLTQAQYPAPGQIYQSARTGSGSFSYMFPNLEPEAPYYVRLHFAEIQLSAAGQRKFNVEINNTRVLTNYDICSEVGANKAVIKEFAFAANKSGQMIIDFSNGDVNNPIVNGIEILSMESNVLLDNLTATNYSYTCRRPFGAGLYDSVSNKTFICYNGYGMSAYVKEYDHNTKRWSEAVEVGRQYPYNGTTAGWHTYMYHDYPVMVMAPDGSLLVFNVDHTHNLFQSKSLTPRSVTGGWDRSRKISQNYDNNCYPMPMVAGNDVFMFYSKNDDTWSTDTYKWRTYQVIKSSNNGTTWSRPQTIINTNKQEPDGFDEVYGWGVMYNSYNNMIGFTWTMAGGKKTNNTVEHNGASKNLYFAYFDPVSNNMKNAAGENLGPVIDVNELQRCLVHELKGNPNSSNWQVNHPFVLPQPSFISSNGYPVVVYGVRESSSSQKIKLAKWNGSTWNISNIDTSTMWFYDFEKIGDDDFRAAIHVSDNKYKILKTMDGGETWTLDVDRTVVFSGGCNKVYELTFIENSKPDVQLFIGQYNSGHSSDSQRYGGTYHIHTVGKLTAGNSLIIESPVYTDINNVQVDNLVSNSLLKATLRVSNPTDTKIAKKMIIALYNKNNSLVQMAIKEIDVDLLTVKNITTELSLQQVTPDHYIKIFVWDSVRGMIPQGEYYYFQ